MRTGKWLLSAAALAVAGVWWYLSRPEPADMRLHTVQQGRVEATVSNTRAGTVEACRRSKLSMPLGGRVEHLAVDEGDRVQPEQVLLNLWNDDREAMVEQSAAAARAAEARRDQGCLTAERDQREAKRVTALHVRKLASDEAADNARTQAAVSRAACAAAHADADTAAAQLALHRAQLEQTLLRAPFAGVVAEINGEVGEYVTPSPPGVATPPAVDLIDDSCLYVSAPIDEVDAASVRLGQTARISLDAFRGQTLQGKVMRIAPYVLDLEKQARTVAVDVRFDSVPGDVRLLVGYSADIEIILEENNALRVPSEAILAGDKVLRFDPENGVLEERQIRRGLRNWSFSEVVEGLRAGDRIVAELDQPGASAGTPVRPVADAGAP